MAGPAVAAPVTSMALLFQHHLADIYNAEQTILAAWPGMAIKASAGPLQAVFQAHLEQTKAHLERLDAIFTDLELRPDFGGNTVVDGILLEAQKIIANLAAPDIVDAALIASAQEIEHFEITRYGTLVAWAKEMGRQEWVELLESTLAEEKAADSALTLAAEERLNRAA
jgi:ferritin-like metal-binding protein YciE